MTTKPTKTIRPDGNPYGLTVLPDPPKPPDAMYQRPHIAKMDQVLRAHFGHRSNTFNMLVSGEGYLCDVPGNARSSPNPDLLVSFDLDIPPSEIEGVANGYTISEVGKPPEFVLEVASETTARRDETVKRDTYASFGVAEYWRFDRTGGRYYVAALAGRCAGGGRVPIHTRTNRRRRHQAGLQPGVGAGAACGGLADGQSVGLADFGLGAPPAGLATEVLEPGHRGVPAGPAECAGIVGRRASGTAGCRGRVAPAAGGAGTVERSRLRGLCRSFRP